MTERTDKVRVEPALVRLLGESDTGKVEAVITTWTQEDLPKVSALGITGTPLRTMPIFLTNTLTSAQLAKLRRSPAVQGVWANQKYPVQMEDTTWITRARYAWEPTNKDNGLPPLGGHGVTGAGIHVAVIDTGADGLHADMDNLVEFCETQQAASGHRNTVICSPFTPNGAAAGNAGPACPADNARVCATDDDGHGSHVSGTIAGSGSASGGRANPHSTIGMAPDAKLHVYSANIGPALFDHEILAAYDDLTYKRERGIYPTVAVNNSWGGGSGSTYDPGDPTHIAIKRAYFAGIVSVFAAGNSGAEHNTLSQQCVSPFVLCVAATTKPDQVVMFSSRGRPSQNQDTNRDGRITEGAGDVRPDNHDPKLGRAFDVGRYRPSVAAPGTNINSINGDMVSCREGSASIGDPDAAAAEGCYVRFNGTSMATPHVTGVAALVAEAYHKGHDNKLPSAQIIMDIIERSSNWFSKLPGWEAEEQGTGRIDAYSAVEFAKEYPNGMKDPVLGTATPRYELSPEVTAASTDVIKGCTGTLSWTVPEVDPFETGEEPSPTATQRYGQHFIVVPEKADRLRITVRWPRHPGANLYLRLWRPGEGRGDPDTAEAPVGNQLRFMADQEAVGLTDTAAIQNTRRFVDVRAPEATTGQPPEQAGIGETVDVPPGLWVLRVFHRVGGEETAGACDLDSQENPKQAQGFNYTVKIEIPTSTLAPTARITEPKDGAVITDRWQQLGSKADEPPSWEGVTNWEVPGTEIPGSIPEPDNRKILYFHGNNHVADPSAPDEASCEGSPGNDDVLTSRCPILLESSQLSSDLAAFFEVPTPLFNGGLDRNPIDPNWTWYVPTTTQIGGAMTVEWWASCSFCGAVIGNNAAWNIRVYADGNLKFQKRVTATPQFPEIPDRLVATVFLPQIIANNRITLQVDPIFIDTQNDTRIYYDSQNACGVPDPNEQSGRCDSLVRMPVDTTGVSGTGPGPQNLRATDRHKFVRLAWQETSGAVKYEIHRDLEPAFVPNPRTRIAVTTGFACSSPENPTWTTENRPGRCYDDPGNHLERQYYYRVVALFPNGARSLPSRLTYNMRTLYDRQVKMKVDRLYGPVFWEYASLFSDPENSWHHWWDTLELTPGPHNVFTRAFHQGIGSPKDRRTYNDSGNDS
ncbi:MAG TPA: S8 family serine peptidase [Actinomycetota bacterium]|nr:S8 family serine peptidase [Actinomycetota bacterium]